MLSSLKKLAALVVVASSMNVFAQGSLELGQPQMGGNGCPIGTASASVAPDGSSLSILFDQFIAEAGPAAGKTLDRKSCNIMVPVRVPQGYSISIVAVDYRGFVGLPSGATARMQAEYFFAGSRGPVFARDFRGAQNDNHLMTNRLGVEAMVWSPCGASTQLRVNASMMVRNNSYHQDAMATVDSVDMSSGILYHTQTRRCF